MTNDPFRMPLTMLPKVRSEAIMRACHLMPCTLRISSFVGRPCSGDVMGCHLDFTHGKGMGTKVSDMNVAAGCHSCHEILDGRDTAAKQVILAKYPTAYMEQCLRALTETHARLVGAGIIVIPDAEIIG
jgi:cytochrome c553